MSGVGVWLAVGGDSRFSHAKQIACTLIRELRFVYCGAPVAVNCKTMEISPTTAAAPAGWTFFTNHAHVLLCLADTPDMRLRDVGAAVGITERAVQKIISELEAGGVLERARQGRRNVYRIHVTQPLRHPVEAHCTVEGLIRFVNDSKPR